MERQCYSFGRFRIDSQSRILLRDEERVAVPPKTADILVALLENGGELVLKEELMRLVWPDTFVEDNNLAKHIFALRKILGNNERGVPYIETVPKRGYRFLGQFQRDEARASPIVEYQDHSREQIIIEETEGSFRSAASRFAWLAGFAIVLILCVSAGVFLWTRSGNRPWRSVLILPFTVSGASDGLLGSAFAQDVAARLRTMKTLRVVSPLSQADAASLSKRLSVETILTGRVDYGNGGVRVSAQLMSAGDGTVLWAEETADLDAGDLRTTQARLASSIAARLCGRLAPGERARLERRGSANAEAYESFLRGRVETLRGDDENAPSNAASHFETALRLDPGFADAWAGLARAQQRQFFRGTAARSVLTTAIQNARQALSIDPENISARDALIRIYYSTGQGEEMLRESKRVLEINSADPDAQAAAGLAYFRTAMLDRAIALYEKYLAAYPDDEAAAYQLVHACLFAREYDRGIRHAQHLLALQRLSFPTFLLYANSGDFTQAVALARRSIASGPVGFPPAYFGPQVLDRAGLHAEAHAAWVRSAELSEAGLSRADNERNRMFLAMIYSRLNQPEAAREQIRRALATNPGDPWILFFASETHALLDDRPAAFNALSRSITAGFLGLHFLDYYQEAPNGWYRYRHDPEFVSIRAGLARKIAELRTRY